MMVVFEMHDRVPSARYSSVCNVLRVWSISLIPTYRVYRLYDNEILPSGYSIFRMNRGSRGGGILIAVADSIPTKLIPSPPNLDALKIIISYSNHILCVHPS